MKMLLRKYTEARRNESDAKTKADIAFKCLFKVGNTVSYRRTYRGWVYDGIILDRAIARRSLKVHSLKTDVVYWVHESWLEL